jgi:DNA-binding transcriptional ArsR family regulator
LTGSGSPALAGDAPRSPAALFAALGDATRLQFVVRLSHDGPLSISALTADASMSRQAVTKHLQVLEEAGLAASRREGRERIYELRPARLAAVHRNLDRIDRHWDVTKARLRAHVERDDGPEQ